MNLKSKKMIADTINECVLDTDTTAVSVREFTKEMIIEGKTRQQWWEHFKIQIGNNIVTPADLREKLVEISKKITFASKYLSDAQNDLRFIQTTITKKQMEAKKRIRINNKEVGANNLKALSDLEISDLMPAKEALNTIASFWEDIYKYLDYMYNILVQLNYTNTNDVRLTTRS